MRILVPIERTGGVSCGTVEGSWSLIHVRVDSGSYDSCVLDL